MIFLQTETALIYDAVRLFSKALHELDLSQNIDISPLSCDGQYTWQHGNSLVNFMKMVRQSFGPEWTTLIGWDPSRHCALIG